MKEYIRSKGSTHDIHSIKISDMVGIKVASELVGSSRKRMDDASKIRGQQAKQKSALGKKRKKTQLKTCFKNSKK